MIVAAILAGILTVSPVLGLRPSFASFFLAVRKEEKQNETLEKPKQLILSNPKKRGKMAAFVDTLYLAFLVGMISGAIFFAMLRFILHSL